MAWSHDLDLPLGSGHYIKHGGVQIWKLLALKIWTPLCNGELVILMSFPSRKLCPEILPFPQLEGLHWNVGSMISLNLLPFNFMSSFRPWIMTVPLRIIWIIEHINVNYKQKEMWCLSCGMVGIHPEDVIGLKYQLIPGISFPIKI